MEKDFPHSAASSTRKDIDQSLMRALFANHEERHSGMQLEVLVLRRAIEGTDTLRGAFGLSRAFVDYWIALEVALASVDGRRITQKDLAARARSVWSQATISRAIAELVAAGLVQVVSNAADRRSPGLVVSGKLGEAFQTHGERTLREARAAFRETR